MNLPDGYYLQGKKYRLTRTIGQGGFGITYLGVWNTEVKGGLGAMKTTVPVCIKEYFFKDYCYREPNTSAVKVHSLTGEKLFGKFKEKLIEEANILSAVHHPNIVNVLEVFEENNTAYIIMEYIKGNSLKMLLENEGTLPEYKAIKYVHQIGNALTFVHEKNIVHLDIKPGNILIDQFDNARLIDFGVSKRYDIEEQETSTTSLTLSKGYASIEQYDIEGMIHFSPTPDIYSLGATMYNMLTTVVPVESILRATKQMPPPSAYNANISRKTEKAILKAMEIKPEDRFRTVNELLVSIDAPVYDFTENPPVESNYMDDDEATPPGKYENNDSESVEDETVMKTSTVQRLAKKRARKRHLVRRRIGLIASILLCAFIGYVIFGYFSDITDSGDSLKGLDLPNDLSSKINTMLANQPDSTETNIPNQPDTIVATQTPVQKTPEKPPEKAPDSNIKPMTAAVNTTTNNTNQSTLPDRNIDTETTKQNESSKREFDALVNDGITKKSNGGYAGALIDLRKALEIGEKLDFNVSEVRRLIAECDRGIEDQPKKDIAVNYDIASSWGQFTIVRINGKFGAIRTSTKEIIIPCKYRTVNSTLSNGNREFVLNEKQWDIYNQNGGFESSYDPTN